MLTSLTGRLAAVFFPSRCVLCGELVSAGDFFCHRCGKTILLVKNACVCCGKPRGSCICKHADWHFQRCISAFLYQEGGRELIRQYKYCGKKQLAGLLAEALAGNLKDASLTSFDRIVPVPMNPASRRKRNYDQTAVLAKKLGKLLSIPVDCSLLRRSDDTVPQHKLDKEQRLKNAAHSYFAKKGKALHGEHILLVDDVVTTGATMEACAARLLEIGAGTVSCAAPATTGAQRER